MSGGHLGSAGRVGRGQRPSLKYGRGWEGLGGPPGSPGEVGKSFGSPEVVGSPSRMSGEAGSPSRRYGRSREGSGGPPGSPGVVERPSRKSRRGQEVLLEVRGSRESLPEVMEGLDGLSGRPRGGPSRKSMKGLEALPRVQKRSGVAPGSLGKVGRPSQKCVKGREAILEVREKSGFLPRSLRRVKKPPGRLKKVGSPSW